MTSHPCWAGSWSPLPAWLGVHSEALSPLLGQSSCICFLAAWGKQLLGKFTPLLF